jgi:hypothetical protein
MQKALRFLAIVILTFIPLAVIAYFGNNTNQNDFVEYWSAGKLFDARANPYSGPMILAIEKSRGFSPGDPLIMLNPPWIMPLVAPLGLLPAFGALVFWICVCAGCLAASVVLLGLPEKNRGLTFLFAPVLGSFMMEQSSPFLLLGLSLFLRFQRTRPFLAGASLLLMALKPHLFLVFWVALAGDCLYRRRFAIMAGFAASTICVSGLVMLMVPRIWLDYLDVVRTSSMDRNAYPTLPSVLRAAINVNLVWIALVPSCLALVWGAVYYWRRRQVWDWQRDGMPVLLVSVLTSPYSWVSDEVVLLPPVAYALSASPRRFSMEILMVVNFAALIWLNVSFRSMVWLPLALALWFAYATFQGEQKRVTETVTRNQ